MLALLPSMNGRPFSRFDDGPPARRSWALPVQISKEARHPRQEKGANKSRFRQSYSTQFGWDLPPWAAAQEEQPAIDAVSSSPTNACSFTRSQTTRFGWDLPPSSAARETQAGVNAKGNTAREECDLK